MLELFNLVKQNKIEEVLSFILKNKILDLDMKDKNENYLINYIILNNQIELLNELLNKENIIISFDIMDNDGRTLFYYCIKYNFIEITNILIDNNRKSIGINILDNKDKIGFTALHYCILFNNFNIFKILLKNHANPYLINKDGDNIFNYSIKKNKHIFIEYLLDQKYHINFVNKNGDTLLQVALIYNSEIINKIVMIKGNLNNINKDEGLTALHQSIIYNNISIFNNILDYININIADFYGNTAFHYIFIYKKLEFLDNILNKNILYNISNINGDIPLHLLLNSNIVNDIDNKFLEKIIINTDINIQNNDGITCFYLLNQHNMINNYKHILVNKQIDFFINNIELTDKLTNLLIESYYNQIKLNKDKLQLPWEKSCFDSEKKCKLKIKDMIVKERKSFPKTSILDLKMDNGIFTNMCFYTGYPIDILFGIILLQQTFEKQGLNIILDYPLTINNNLEDYYTKIGLNYPFKNDFSNFEIIWVYQKIFFPTYFEIEIELLLKKSKYIVIPIGISISQGSHANILFWDVENKTIERFEPNGSNYPNNFNYNPDLLDDILYNKFKYFDNNIKYYKPQYFLPVISFQILENLENENCKKIGDPNGFCAVWCIWWVYQRMLNIHNNEINITNFANELIKIIKFDNISFKNIIRNFSKKITEIRDKLLITINKDINDWITHNYTEEELNKLERNIIKLYL